MIKIWFQVRTAVIIVVWKKFFALFTGSCATWKIKCVSKVLLKFKSLTVKSSHLYLECTYTLLNLADDLRTIFKPVKTLKEIHEAVILHPHRYNAKTCSVYLITNLHKSLDFTVNKQEQDLKLTLFLNSLYPYLSKTDSWLTKDELCDEFLIKQY